MANIEDYRKLFPITEECTFLNNAAVSPTSLRVRDSVEALLKEFSTCGLRCYGRWMKRIAEVRDLFARLIGADPAEIAFTGNTSEGLSIVASGIDWKSGEAVLVPVFDFPSNVYPWMNLERKGVKIYCYEKKDGRFGVPELEKALRPGVRLVTVSSVDYVTGFRCDLEALGEFCRQKGILLCIDAIQSLGAIPFDAKKCGAHFVASGGHKWLVGMMGVGALYVSPEASGIIHPDRVGWRSVVNEEDFSALNFELKGGALRFESGTQNVVGIYALGAAADLILEIGVDTIWKKIRLLNDGFAEGLRDRRLRVVSSMVESERSGILSFIPPGSPGELFNHFASKGVSVSHRGEFIRLSPHFYNNEKDVEIFFRVLDGYMDRL